MKKTNKRLLSAVISVLMILSMIFTANAALVGDVTGDDNDVTAADARIILRASVSLENLSDEMKLIADADENGKITAADARHVLRMSVGLEEKLHFYKKEVITAPDCINPGTGKATCTQCDDTYEYDIPALGHDFGEPEIITQVTCDTDGLEKYTCKRTNCKIVEERTVTAGHIWNREAPSCTEDKFCTRGNHIAENGEKLGHTTDWGKCTNCNVFITDKHPEVAATVKAKFLEAKAYAEKAYAEINKSQGAASWLRVYTTYAKPMYQTSKTAYEAALAACGDIEEFKEIKVKLQKNIDNLTGTLAQCDVIMAGPKDPAPMYFEFIAPIDDLNYFAKDCIYNTNEDLEKLIIW